MTVGRGKNKEQKLKDISLESSGNRQGSTQGQSAVCKISLRCKTKIPKVENGIM